MFLVARVLVVRVFLFCKNSSENAGGKSDFSVKNEAGYDNSFYCFKSAAEKNHTEAMLELAKCYIAGKGVKESVSTATKYFILAAEQGSGEACYEVFNMLWCQAEAADDDKKLYEEAAEWLKKSSDYGYELGQLGYGRDCYCGSEFVKQDVDKGLELFRLAVEQNDALAIIVARSLIYEETSLAYAKEKLNAAAETDPSAKIILQALIQTTKENKS